MSTRASRFGYVRPNFWQKVGRVVIAVALAIACIITYILFLLALGGG